MESNQLINNKINSINVFDWIDCLLFVDGWNGLLSFLLHKSKLLIAQQLVMGRRPPIHSIILNKQLTFSLVKTIL